MSTWVTIRTDRGERVGVVADGTVHALDEGVSLLGLLTSGADLAESAARALASPALTIDVAQADIAPLLRPPVLADSAGFLDHLRHCFPSIPEEHERLPFFYINNPLTVLGAHDPVAIAAESSQFDYELEIGAVLGRGGANLTPEEGSDAIAGYTIFVDWSARDLQFERSVVMKAKDAATTLGPFFVTKDEFESRRSGKGFDIRMDAVLNGRLMTSGNWSTIDWDFGDIVSYMSRGSQVSAGTVIGSGTVPWGCLLEFERARPDEFPGWLKPGDRVTLRVDLLGSVDHVIVESEPWPPLSTGY